MIECDVAIVGGGFSGCAVAVQLARRAESNSSIALFEPGELGRGAAYGTRHPEHLLNTRAQAMSIYPDDPDHFVRWLGPRGAPEDFVSRRLYGDYVASVARRAFERPGFSVIPERARVLHRGPDDVFIVESSAGTRVEARAVVLATGNAPPNDGFLPAGILAHPGYVGDPWRFDYHTVGGHVLLIGTGLTALDVLVALETGGHRGAVHAVSRRGYFPQTHADVAPYDAVPALDAAGACVLLRSFRRHVREAVRCGFDWRAVVDATRSEGEAIWKRLPPAERRRFERHVRSHWERHRHRAPAQVDAVRRRYLEAGRLFGYAGRVAEARDGGVTIRLAAGGTVELRPDWIVNCTGLGRSDRIWTEPLLAGLLECGMVSSEPCGLGIRVDSNLVALDAAGRPVPGLWFVGPPVRGSRFEATAVPELRTMAETVAAQALGSLRPQASLTG